MTELVRGYSAGGVPMDEERMREHGLDLARVLEAARAELLHELGDSVRSRSGGAATSPMPVAQKEKAGALAGLSDSFDPLDPLDPLEDARASAAHRPFGSAQCHCRVTSTRRASAALPLPVVCSGFFSSILSSATPAAVSASRTAKARCLASSSFAAGSPEASV